MTKVILVTAAETDWQTQGRLVGDTDLPISETGQREAERQAMAIAAKTPTAIRSGSEEATKQTAQIIAKAAGLKLKSVKGLRELSLGHWAGLTEEDLRERFGKVYRQWKSDPLSVVPPNGEALADAATRITKSLGELLKQHTDGLLVIVLGRFALALVRCHLDGDRYDDFWNHVASANGFVELAVPRPEELVPVAVGTERTLGTGT